MVHCVYIIWHQITLIQDEQHSTKQARKKVVLTALTVAYIGINENKNNRENKHV